MSLDELYQEVILDHYRNPRCRGSVETPSARCSLFNPLCGDQIEVTLTVQEGRISEIAFTGHGCSISQAAASMVSDLCKGKTVDGTMGLSTLFRQMMRGEKEGVQLSELGDAVALEGVRKFSARVKCAMLAWEAIEKCLEEVPSGETR
jgi:nitrogen fixation protein NifU and related proteins